MLRKQTLSALTWNTHSVYVGLSVKYFLINED